MLIAQGDVTTDLSEVKDIKSLMSSEKYTEARVKLADVLKKDAENRELVLLFSECVLKDSPNKSEGIRVLEPFLNSYSGKDLLKAKSLLAQLYQREYQFDKAIELYTDLDTLLTLNALTNDYKVLISQCESAKLLMKNIQSVQVQPVKNTTNDKVGQDYNKIVGRKLSSKRKYKSKPASMASFEGQAKNESLSILEIDGGEIRIYPEFKGNRLGTSDKDLVIEHKEHGTSWYNREYVSDLINSDYDEDYPYLSMDNQTLYFCSNGPASMGGYDIFRCQRDTVTGYWGKPINMGFPINSTADEFLFVEDSVDMVAYFASSRFNNYGDVTVYQMPIKKAYSSNSSFFINREIKNTDSLYIENLALGRLNDFQYVFVGSLDPVKNRILYTVEELEQLSLVFSLSNGENYEFELFSPLATSNKEISYSLVYENGSVRFYKNFQDNSTGNSQLLGMLSGQDANELNKNKVVSKVILTERSDSINFSNISSHLIQAKQRLLVKERRFSSFVKQLNKTSQGLGNWVFSNNTSGVSMMKEHQKAEHYFNLVVAASKVYKQDVLLLEIARNEVKLLEEVSFVVDSMARMTDEVLKERKKEKLFTYFKNEYEKLNEQFETAINEYYSYLEILRKLKDRLDIDKKSLQEGKYYNISRKALLQEERKTAVRELENAWWRRKKRKMAAIISEIDQDIFEVNSLVAKDSLLDNRRSKTKDYLALFYRAKDWRYLNNEKIVFKTSPNLDLGIVDSSRNQIDSQFSDFVNSVGKIPTTFSLVDSKEELADTSSNYVYISDLRKVNWDAFEFDKKQAEYLSSFISIDTSFVETVMETVKKEIVQEDQDLFRIHTVSLKETIHSIARNYNVTVKEIISWNSYSESNIDGINWEDSTRTGAKKNWLYVGEKLRVIMKYKVKSGDSLKKIADMHNCSVGEIKKWNAISINNPAGIDWDCSRRTGDKLDWLYIGENLIIGAK